MNEQSFLQTSESIKELIVALCKFQSEVKPVIKDAQNPFFKSKYADLAGCIEATKGTLAANGLAVIHTTHFENGVTILVTLLLHISGQYIRGDYLVSPLKNDPQSMGSAMTYARRYTYLGILGIAPEDDDGARASGTISKETALVLDTPGEYVITFGQHYKGKKIKDLPVPTLQKQMDYVEGLQNPYPAASEFLKNAKAYLTDLALG